MYYKSITKFIITGLILTSSTYIHPQVSAQNPTRISQSLNAKTLIKEELYFGLAKPTGKMVSELEWQLFLGTIITPRFPEGLTVIDAYGHYFTNSDNLVREKTKIVVLIYRNSNQRQKMVSEIITNYKRIFHQESVLRVTSTVKAEF
ncbi:DUF3574 domain-containing protein [Calothrix sp. 336/3]|uniref:DUF3574 domain-containing protein n=1 Tax=Calothrix sp. 336/3 TaxID=1337936 RepID=UPI0004E3AB92|nr:DUF3574 domain-containing protein [Calothrix sp. 336/3]AKG21809.1 lipoprotein [Calothrix sp. 336/3]